MTHPRNKDQIREMLSAYLDGELTQADEQRVRLHLEEFEGARQELKELAALKNLTAELRFPTPSDEFLDQLENRVSVRWPRRFGWGLVLLSVAGWILYTAVLAVTNLRWPTTGEMLGGGLVAGGLLVFVSVLRQRVLERPHDRYRKVKR